VNSVTTVRFRKAYSGLPEHIQKNAVKAFRVWKKDIHHPSIQYKQIHKTKPIFSVRITLSYRAIGVKEKSTMIWFWIGTHAEYDKLISSL
jgi:hypothetical protein